jgi:SAM-dependent methyltransferase
MKGVRGHGALRTEDARYAERLVKQEMVWWKRLLDVQRPYRIHLRRLDLGFVLEVGCGLGRNLKNLGEGAGVGIDHNTHSVALARARGVEAFTTEEFKASAYAQPSRFDSLLLSHVAEHMRPSEVVSLLSDYHSFVRPGGRFVMITPQELGFRSDPTHVEFVDFEKGASIAREAQLELVKQYSFPFPRRFGNLFKYNEFVTISRKPA